MNGNISIKMKKDLICWDLTTFFKILEVYHVNAVNASILCNTMINSSYVWRLINFKIAIPDLSVQYFGVFIEYFQFISVIS